VEKTVWLYAQGQIQPMGSRGVSGDGVQGSPAALSCGCGGYAHSPKLSRVGRSDPTLPRAVGAVPRTGKLWKAICDFLAQW